MSPQKIDFSDLSRDTKNDIKNIISDYHPIFKKIEYFSHPDHIIEFINDTPGISVEHMTVNPIRYSSQIKNVSDRVVDMYAAEIESGKEFDPILISGDKFIDGNHRLAAYINAGKTRIPAIDISNILDFNWEREVKNTFG
jgi:hypothetical protein